jgi:hypothetical protein
MWQTAIKHVGVSLVHQLDCQIFTEVQELEDVTQQFDSRTESRASASLFKKKAKK